jgi:hypothetical protein
MVKKYVYQMAKKYTNIIYSKAIQNTYTLWQPWYWIETSWQTPLSNNRLLNFAVDNYWSVRAKQTNATFSEIYIKNWTSKSLFESAEARERLKSCSPEDQTVEKYMDVSERTW